MIEGVLFDMDGVLIDSEKYICQAAMNMFEEHGIIVKPQDFLPFVGKGENMYLSGVAKKYNFPIEIERDKARTYAIYEEISRNKLEPLPGVYEFIDKCKSKNLKIAVATSADRIKMEINLKALQLNENTFHATVNGLEIERKKPFPDIFIHAAFKIGVDSKKCLVVEDAPSGIRAAKEAGCKILALTTSFPIYDLSLADWFAPDLSKAPKEVLEW